MKKCKNCKINDARYICLECNREFCTFCMKEDEIFCYQCRYNKRNKKGELQEQENNFKLQKNLHNTTNIINIIIAASILFLGILIVLVSYPSLLNMSSIIGIDGIFSEEKNDNKNNDKGGFIYIFPFPFAIPIEVGNPFIIPLVLSSIIIIPIIIFVIVLRTIKNNK